MKEFETWKNTVSANTTWLEGAESGWKAALKWALEQETWIGPDEGGGWGIDEDDIEEELKSVG